MGRFEPCDTCGDPPSLRYFGGYILAPCPECEQGRPMRNLPSQGPGLREWLRSAAKRLLGAIR